MHRIIYYKIFSGKQMSADKNPGRLLLLRVWVAGAVSGPREERGGDGAGYDRCHCVSFSTQTLFPVIVPDI